MLLTPKTLKLLMVYVDDENNFYVDGVLELTSSEFNSMVEVSKIDPDMSSIITPRSAETWHYLDTYNYSIDFQNRGRTILLSVISLAIPILSPAIGIGSILDSLLGQSAPGMYVKVSRYYKNDNNSIDIVIIFILIKQ